MANSFKIFSAQNQNNLDNMLTLSASYKQKHSQHERLRTNCFVFSVLDISSSPSTPQSMISIVSFWTPWVSKSHFHPLSVLAMSSSTPSSMVLHWMLDCKTTSVPIREYCSLWSFYFDCFGKYFSSSSTCVDDMKICRMLFCATNEKPSGKQR